MMKKNEHNEFDENHSRYTKAEDNFEDLDPSTNNEWTDDDENKKKSNFQQYIERHHLRFISCTYRLELPHFRTERLRHMHISSM